MKLTDKEINIAYSALESADYNGNDSPRSLVEAVINALPYYRDFESASTVFWSAVHDMGDEVDYDYALRAALAKFTTKTGGSDE